jgi:hypothetical protein
MRGKEKISTRLAVHVGESSIGNGQLIGLTVELIGLNVEE